MRGRAALGPARIAAALAGVLAAVSFAGAQVYLRGQGDALSAEITRVGPEGVGVKIGEASKTIGWDRVREVRGERAGEAAKFDGPGGLGEQVWRARTRLERGDFGAAEPLLDPLVDGVRRTPGPTAAVIFEGLVRCRLRRGAGAGAVFAWLDWVHARGGYLGSEVGEAWIGGKVDGAGVMDAQTGLMTALPPVFVRDAAIDASAASEEWARYAGEEPVVADLAMLYRAAARFEAGLEPQLGKVSSTSDGVRLVGDVVRARVGDEEERKQARGALQARLDGKEIEPWVECWCRVGIGRSLLREESGDAKRQGVLQLLHAPARFVRVSPGLAAAALAESCVALHDMGDEQGASALKGELFDRFSMTAAAGWARLREVRAPGEAARKQGEPAKPSDAGKQGRKDGMGAAGVDAVGASVGKRGGR